MFSVGPCDQLKVIFKSLNFIWPGLGPAEPSRPPSRPTPALLKFYFLTEIEKKANEKQIEKNERLRNTSSTATTCGQTKWENEIGNACILTIFDRTNLIIGQSKAKDCKESAGDVGIDVAPQKPSKNIEKRRIVGDIFFSNVEKQNVRNRPKRVFAKFRCKRI